MALRMRVKSTSVPMDASSHSTLDSAQKPEPVLKLVGRKNAQPQFWLALQSAAHASMDLDLHWQTPCHKTPAALVRVKLM